MLGNNFRDNSINREFNFAQGQRENKYICTIDLTPRAMITIHRN